MNNAEFEHKKVIFLKEHTCNTTDNRKSDNM